MQKQPLLGVLYKSSVKVQYYPRKCSLLKVFRWYCDIGYLQLLKLAEPLFLAAFPQMEDLKFSNATNLTNNLSFIFVKKRLSAFSFLELRIFYPIFQHLLQLESVFWYFHSNWVYSECLCVVPHINLIMINHFKWFIFPLCSNFVKWIKNIINK